MSFAPWALSAAALSLSCQLTPPLETAGANAPVSESRFDPCGGASAEGSRVDSSLPERVGRFCRDPGVPTRAFGGVGEEPLRRACERVLGPSCFRDLGHGLSRVSVGRYLDAGEPTSGVDVIVSEFESSETAHAHFSDALIGDADPLHLELTAVEAAGTAVIDRGRLFAWRGRRVLRLSAFEAAPVLGHLTPEAERHLTEMGQALLGRLPDNEGVPRVLSRLPSDKRIPFGARLSLGDALGVPGLGANAVGYYREGDKRWRVLAILRPDAESAKDVMSTLERHPHAHDIKGLPWVVEFVERRLPSEPRIQWVIGQRGEVVYGVGDEPAALPEFMPAAAEAKVKLGLHEKLVKLSRIHLP